MSSQTYDAVDKAWKSTCKVLFGGEIGELDSFSDYLPEQHYIPYSKRKSCVSGKPVIMGADRYPADAKFISEDEIDYGAKEALDMNSIKDLDALIESLSDRFRYSGNKIFGVSSFVQEADNCIDSSYVYRSHNVVSSKYVAYSNFVRADSEFIFGSGPLMHGSHLIRVMGSESLSRSFECAATTFSSDMYLSFNCRGCTDCMFCFNLRSKKYCIGNLELPREKYLEIKKKLLAEMREYLIKHKRFRSVFDFASPPSKEAVAKVHAPEVERKVGDLAPIEGAFKSASRLVFGKELSPLTNTRNSYRSGLRGYAR